MTLPRARRPWLIVTLSLNRAPTAPVFFARSEPARSTRCSLAQVRSEPGARGRCSTMTEKRECEREETAFINVEPVARAREPASREAKSSSRVWTTRSCTPAADQDQKEGGGGRRRTREEGGRKERGRSKVRGRRRRTGEEGGRRMGHGPDRKSQERDETAIGWRRRMLRGAASRPHRVAAAHP